MRDFYTISFFSKLRVNMFFFSSNLSTHYLDFSTEFTSIDNALMWKYLPLGSCFIASSWYPAATCSISKNEMKWIIFYKKYLYWYKLVTKTKKIVKCYLVINNVNKIRRISVHWSLNCFLKLHFFSNKKVYRVVHSKQSTRNNSQKNYFRKNRRNNSA